MPKPSQQRTPNVLADLCINDKKERTFKIF
jgi:hypothetical protein